MSSPTAADICTAFSLGDPVELSEVVARGEVGEVRRLTTDRGVWAVKEAFEAPDEDEVRVAGDFQGRCHAEGVACPQPMTTKEGGYVAWLGDAAVSVASWVAIEDPDPTIDPATVGKAVARLHRVRSPATAAPHWWHTDPLGERHWRALARSARGAGAPFVDQLAALVPALVDVETILTPMAPVQLCHNDLWADNLRPTPTGGVCAIDFDNTGPADPTRELAMVLFEFGAADVIRLRSIVGAYAEAGGPGRATRLEDFAMVVAQLDHIGSRHVEAWLGAGDDESRARARAGVEEFLSAPPTRARLEQILDLLG